MVVKQSGAPGGPRADARPGLALVLAIVGGSAIGNTLFDVSPRDPLTYAVVFTLVTVVSLAAVLVPGRRASRVDPMIALRAE
jgi:ABC-type antimicrobial peptide transport system permease subunit